MQAKGFIKFIIAGLLFFAIYQLSFTFIGYHFQKKAALYAQEKAASYSGNEALMAEKQFRNYYLDSIKNEKVLNLGFTKLTYGEINDQQLKLGLDLKGGISLLVEIDNADILRKLAHNTDDKFFNEAIALTEKNANTNQETFLNAFLSNYNKVSNKGNLAAIFAPYEEYKGKIDWKDSNDKVIKALENEVQAKWAETFNVLSTRIDQFGVTNPFISKPDLQGRIYVELPGAEDSERIRKIIQTSALLEFYKVYELQEIDKVLSDANDIVRTKLGLDEGNTIASDTTAINSPDTTSTASVKDTSDLGDLSKLENNLTTEEDTSKKQANPLYEIFQPNYGQKDGKYFYNGGPVIGYANKRDKNKIDEYLAYEEVQSILPRDLKFMWSAKPIKNEDGTLGDIYTLFAVKANLDGSAFLNGDVIVDAYNSKDEMGQDIVGMSMNTQGATKWAAITKEANPTGDKNSGKSIAIVLDNKVFSAPRSNGEIKGGSSQITGMDDLAEAQDLANILKSGKLEAKINVPQEAVVGATLGKVAIQSGLTSLALGLLMVVLFMYLYYNGAGLLANGILIINLVLIMGALTSLRAALTLPGMAGIVLTIGMAVDANVIIFERIREELRLGKAFKQAVADGFSHSYSAIIDSNITSIIAGLVLLIFGAGAVKGFAVVLLIGIIASFITAVFLSRLVFEFLMDRNKEISFSRPFSDKVFVNTNYDILGKRKIAYAASALFIIAGLISIFTSGFELGVDFKGGRSYVIEFDQAVSTDAVREKLSETFGEESVVKKFDVDSKVQIITAYKVDDQNIATDSLIASELYSSLTSFYKNAPSEEEFVTTNIIQANKVDTNIADDIKVSAYEAGLIGTFLIFLYIIFRFRKWQYGAGAIIALFHDVLVILAVFSIFKDIMPFSLEIEQKFIAAILTIIGYSINDTVIVYDRIREYINEHPSKDLVTNVNDAINGTLSRTVMTSFTTIIVVIVLFLFGGSAIKGFSFALLVGIVVGTYSSIFIASAIVVDTWKLQEKRLNKKN